MSRSADLLQFLTLLGLFTRPAIVGIILAGLWVGLQRTVLDRHARRATWLAIALPLMIWLGLAWTLAMSGVFQNHPGVPNPAIPLAIVVPVLVGLVFLIRSERMAAVADAMPSWWIIGLQFYRVIGGVFLVLWAHGNLPGVFAVPAGAGDLLTGLLAIPTALGLRAAARGSRTAAYLWNLLGILDLVTAVSLGVLTSPGPLQLLAGDQPNLLVGTYPLVMIPVFGVPLSLILHGLSLWQLARANRQRIPAAPWESAPSIE